MSLIVICEISRSTSDQMYLHRLEYRELFINAEASPLRPLDHGAVALDIGIEVHDLVSEILEFQWRVHLNATI